MTIYIARLALFALLALSSAQPAHVLADDPAKDAATPPPLASAAERFADSVMDAKSFDYTYLVAFEVLGIESIPQVGEHIPESWYCSADIHLARCRVVSRIYGPLTVGEVFFVLVPAWQSGGENLANADRFLLEEGAVFLASLWDSMDLKWRASEGTNAALKKVVGSQKSLQFKWAVHRISEDGGARRLPHSDFDKSEIHVDRASAIAALEARVAELTPRIVFELGAYTNSGWSAVLGPDSVLRVSWKSLRKKESDEDGKGPTYERDEGVTETPLNPEQVRRVTALLGDFEEVPAELSVSRSKTPDDRVLIARVFTRTEVHSADIWQLQPDDKVPGGAELFYQLAKTIGVCDLDLWGASWIELIHERTLEGAR